MSKHVLYHKDEVLERITHEFTKGMAALDGLESEIRVALDVLTAIQLHTAPPEPPRRRQRAKKAAPLVSPTAADHVAADLLAQGLVGRNTLT